MARNEATALLNDYDYLVQALFAEQANTALESHRRLRAGPGGTAEQTKFEQLSEIWDLLLPHRLLNIGGDDITVSVPGNAATYSASEMSDGERAVFYLVGQTLVASENSVLVIDEPELHLHPSIMTLLWDELSTARPDCAFVFITHSLEFAAARPGAKYVVRDYRPDPMWTIDPVPRDTGFSEEFTTLILGNRRPVLFVEGTATSLDRSIYEACYPDYLVLPRSSCEAVIHAVASMQTNAALTRVTCHGIVDGDTDQLMKSSICAIAAFSYSPSTNWRTCFSCQKSAAPSPHMKPMTVTGSTRDWMISDERCSAPSSHLARSAPTVLRYVTRQVDRQLKRIDVSAATSIKDSRQPTLRRPVHLT